MQSNNILDQIRRIKKNVKQVSKRSKQIQERSFIKKSRTQDQMLVSNNNYQSVNRNNSKSKSQYSSTNSSHQVSKQIASSSQPQPVLKQYSFEGKKFLFPIRDVQLTNKRVQLFQKIIKSRGGYVLNSQQAYFRGVDYIINSTNTSKYTLKKSLYIAQKQQIKHKKIVNFQYIIDCQKAGQCLDVLPYELFRQKDQKQILKQINQGQKIRQIQQQITDHQNIQQDLSSTLSLKYSIVKKSSKIERQQFQNTHKKPLARQEKNPSHSNFQFNKDKFACQAGSSQSQFPMNQYIYQQLMKFYNIYQSQKDTGRKIAYLKGASTIKSFHKEIQSEKDIMKLRGIGKKIVNKVKELLETGQIQKLQSLKQKQQTLICQQLSRVWGIGASKAKQLYMKGIISLQMLQLNQDLLNKNQKIGLKYVQQFQKRIPRQKVKRMFEYVRRSIWELVSCQDLHVIQVCGSFRRGKQTCGDIDIIISRKDGTFENNLVIDLINKLQIQGFLTDHLSIPSLKHHEANKSISYMGVCKFQQPIHHRIDVKYYHIQHFAFATLYFTGSDMFNRSMRLFARKKGYSLSDHGLIPVQRNVNNQKIWKGSQIKAYTQRQIFEFLGLDYKSPQERNV